MRDRPERDGAERERERDLVLDLVLPRFFDLDLLRARPRSKNGSTPVAVLLTSGSDLCGIQGYNPFDETCLKLRVST